MYRPILPHSDARRAFSIQVWARISSSRHADRCAGVRPLRLAQRRGGKSFRWERSLPLAQRRGARKMHAFQVGCSMRLISFSVMIALVLLSSVALAQQSPETTTGSPVGDTIGHPPPLAGPPPVPNRRQRRSRDQPHPRLWQKSPPRKVTREHMRPPVHRRLPTRQVSCRRSNFGPGLARPAPDGSTKTVKAVPCSTAAHETDGFTTCVGIPDQNPKKHRR